MNVVNVFVGSMLVCALLTPIYQDCEFLTCGFGSGAICARRYLAWLGKSRPIICHAVSMTHVTFSLCS